MSFITALLRALFGTSQVAKARLPGTVIGYTDRTNLPIYKTATDYPWDAKRWPNFKPEEFDCKGTGRMAIDPEALDKLQKLRNVIGKPFRVVSAYRSPEHNAAVGGAEYSQHMYGRAFDISMNGINQEAFVRAAINCGFDGIGTYKTFTHVDTRGEKARWDER